MMVQDTSSLLLAAAPEMFIAAAALLLLVLGVTVPVLSGVGKAGGHRSMMKLSVLALIAGALILLVIGPESGTDAQSVFVVDAFSLYFKIFVIGGTIMCLYLATDYLETVGYARYEYYILVLLCVVGMMIMVSTRSFLVMYLGLELQSLCLYVLAAFERERTRSSEAGLKYFVLGGLASGLLLYGISLVYGVTGSAHLGEIATVIAEGHAGGFGSPLSLGIIFIIAGLGFKLSAAPFHMWTPDVYQGAPTPVTAFLSAIGKLAAIAMMIRILFEAFPGVLADWQPIIIALSVLSMVVGGFGAIGQRDIKRLLGYSAISHVGYALIGVALGSEEGLRAVLTYMVIYLVMTVGTFGIILALHDKEEPVADIDSLAGLSKSHPMMALMLGLLMFSMAGIPPLAGFFAKMFIFLAAIQQGFVILAVVGVLLSVVASFYYLRIIKIMYFDEAPVGLVRAPGSSRNLVTMACVLLVTVFFIAPSVLLEPSGKAAEVLFPSAHSEAAPSPAHN